MKTDDLIQVLARGAEADVANVNAARRRFVMATSGGLLAAGLMMTVLLGVRSDLSVALMLPMFWAKLAFVASLAVLSWQGVSRLARPGIRLGRLPVLLLLPLLAMLLLAIAALWPADAIQRRELFFGETWLVCPFLIALLSVPAFIGLNWAMHALAPVRLRMTGGFVGLLSGALAGIVYSVHCPEMGAPFIAVWYTLGMCMPALCGLWLGPRILRW